MEIDKIHSYSSKVSKGLREMRITDKAGEELGSMREVIKYLTGLKGKNKIAIIGNGGSAAIANHYAQDFTKCAGIRAVHFNDPALLTMLGNDFSFEDSFAKSVEMYCDPGDVLVAISSSGNSKNILNAVEAAKKKNCFSITLSAFKPDNKLSSLGNINVYVPCSTYGTAESAHFVLLHALLDQIVKENS